MTRLFRVGLAATIGLAMAAPAGFAQQPAASTTAPDPAASLMVTETRSAAPTFQGDTGLWFVPLGEVLPAGRWSASAYYTNFDRQEGFTDIGFFPVTFGYGVGGRAELFAALSTVTRIDRDIRPVFLPGSEAGGPVNGYPLARQPWSGTTFGDLYVGGKVSLLSQARNAPVAMALKAMVKLPTGSADKGTSSGQADFFVDYIISKEVNERFDISGYAGYAARADAERTDQSNGIRYGVGLGLPSRSRIKVTAELFGESYFDDTLTSSGLTAFDAVEQRRDLADPQPARRCRRRHLLQLEGLLHRRRCGLRAQARPAQLAQSTPG